MLRRPRRTGRPTAGTWVGKCQLSNVGGTTGTGAQPPAAISRNVNSPPRRPGWVVPAACAPSRVRRCHLGRRGIRLVALASPAEVTLARATSFVTALVAAIGLTACGTFAPEPHSGAPFHRRTESKDDGDFRVTIAALSREETVRFLGLDLDEKGVQPVWVEIENRTGQAGLVPPHRHRSGLLRAERGGLHVPPLVGRGPEPAHRRPPPHDLHPAQVPARGAVRGFVYTHAGQGAPFVRVEVLDNDRLREFRFVADYPGGKWDFQRIDFDALYPASSVRDLDLPGFLAELDKLPCCAADARGRPDADPLNSSWSAPAPSWRFPWCSAAGTSPSRCTRDRPGEA